MPPSQAAGYTHRHDAHTDTFAYHFAHTFESLHSNPEPEDMSSNARMVIDVILQGGACGQTDEGFRQNLSKCDGIPLCEPVRCRNDQRQMVLGNRLELKAGRLNGIRDDPGLGQSSRNTSHDFLARPLLDLKT